MMLRLFRKPLFAAIFLLFPFFGYAQPPQGYYENAEGKYGEELRTALFGIIGPHISVSYNSLWNHFYSTDKKPNGYVWDMYSDIPGGQPAYDYEFITDQCGNYSGEGWCYNREHSFPKSWFGNQSPMSTDMFHLYPVDGYTNGRRNNYPYGESDGSVWVSTNGSKLGYSTYPGYSEKVFEPIDEYKGDFARTYFYMITCYKNRVSNWSSPMLDGDGFSEWALNLLMEWHENDPVSTKEINRNNAIFNIQENRNPFIDHPDYVEKIWGNPVSVAEYYRQTVAVAYSGHGITVTTTAPGVFDTMIIYNTMGEAVGRYDVTGNRMQIEQNLGYGVYIIRLLGPAAETTVKFAVFR